MSTTNRNVPKIKLCGTSEGGVDFVPLLFAGDINVYSMARTFYEAYGCKSYAYGKFPTGICMNSEILSYCPDPKCEQPDEFLKLVRTFAADHKNEKVLLIGCGDSYVELISAAKNYLPENVIAPYVDLDLIKSLTLKENFYDFCDEKGIDRPDTYVYHCGDSLDFVPPFGGPFIVKPSNSPEYWAHPYDTQKKVYKVDTLKEVYSVLMDIYGAGYEDAVIIQNFIPGDDSYMRVLTSYSDRNGKVVMMCLGHVILEEHTPHGVGNHAVIITEYDEELMMKYKNLLEELHFVGFSNFDIKYDQRDGKFKTFEINIRQGRSNYYVTAAGANLAKLLVEDRIDGKDLELNLVNNEFLWTVLPMRVAEKYANPAYLEKMRALVKENKVDNPIYCDADRSTARNKFIVRNQYGQFYKYFKYMGWPGKRRQAGK